VLWLLRLVCHPILRRYLLLTTIRIQQDKEAEYHSLNNTAMVETAEPVVKENMTVEQTPIQG
jgi:hypothetical protein